MTQLPAPRETNRSMHRLEQLVRQQEAAISCITSFSEFLMAIDPQVAAEIATLKQAVVDDQASDQAVVSTLDGIIADLKAGSNPADVIAALQDVKAQITTVTSANTPTQIP
jgi:PleD family two-component response regulator